MDKSTHNLITLIESGDLVLVTGAIDIIVEAGRAELEHAGQVGRAAIPNHTEAQYLILSGEYCRIAQQVQDPFKKLWQYAVALSAAEKANSPDCTEVCREAIQREFPDLSDSVREYFGMLIPA